MNYQAQMQEFLNNFNIQNTPPDKAQETLHHIRKFYDQLPDQKALDFVLYKVTEYIMRLKLVNQDIRTLVEQCIFDIIDYSVKSEFKIGTAALKMIFDTGSQYYKHHNQDPGLKYPLGQNRKLNWYEPEVGESVDIVRPYITSTSYCGWTRGILVERQNKKFVIKYDNTESTVILRQLPFFDKVGTRTKDHDWRMNLDIGMQIDAYNRVWYPSTVVEVGVDNGSKRVRVSYRRFSENGQKQDSHGNKYDGLGPNEDEWVDVLSSRIQRPGKMAKELCYYSFSADEIQIDDTYDLIFEKEYEEQPFEAIMRVNYTRSTSYLHFFEYLVKKKGYQIFQAILQKRDTNIDTVINLMLIFGFTSFMVPRMRLNVYLPKCLELGIAYIKQNYKDFNNWRLDMFSQFVNFIGNRLFSLSKKHIILNQLRKFLALQFLKLNLEKNLVAIRFLIELIKPLRPYQTQEEKHQLFKYFVDNQIFYKIIQNNVHEQVLARSVDVLKFLLENHLIGWNQIQHIWNVIPHNDLRGRATIEKLLADISKSLKIQYTEKIIDLILNLKETELTADKLNLLRTLKNQNISLAYKQKILYYLWQCLTVKSTNIKQNIEQQIQHVYRGFITTIKQNQLKLPVLKAMLKRLKEINTVRNETPLIRQFILTYPTKLEANAIVEEGGAPQTIRDVIQYLKTQNIYENVLRLLAAAKTKEKIESILQFLDFLFTHDSSDISLIVKLTYDILGPSQTFLIWAKNLTYRAINFFIDMYQNPQNMQKFEKINNSGIESIKTILLDINVYKGNIKILKKKKATVQISGPVGPSGQGPVSTGTSAEGDYSLMSDKAETLTFIYVLKSPFECIGLSFLLELLQYISSSSVYNDVIKLIIQFIVNLDDKIFDQAKIFMSEFLERIMLDIQNICNANVYNDNVKLHLETYLNLLQELFAQTEKQGLGNVMPHSCALEGQTLKLKIQNQLLNSDIHKKEPLILESNENESLWKFKQKLAEIYKIPATKLDVIKYVNPIEDSNLGKSLSDLFFFNQEAIKIQKKDAQNIPRFQLLNDDNQSLTPRFENIVNGWFDKYKNQKGVMGIVELLQLGSENWKGSLMKQKDKLMNIIDKHDKDKKGGIYVNEFKQFFIKAAYEQNSMVWRLINLSGYKNNLRHSSQEDNQLNEESLPRKILSMKFVYNTIFKILSSPTFQPLHLTFYRFLSMLETDHQLCNEIKGNIKDFFQNQKCIYKLSYGIETLLNQLEKNNNLYGQFYEQNGHIEIANKLGSLFMTEESVYKFEQFTKVVVIPNLLRLLSLYVYPLISQNKYIRFLKKLKINQLDVAQIITCTEKEENYAQDEQKDKRQILLSKGNHLNFDELYRLCFKIFDNVISNYDKQFLVKITNEIAKIYGYLAVVYPNFKPSDLFKGSNSESLNIRRSCHSLIYIYYLQNPEQKFNIIEQLISEAPPDIKYVSNTYYDLVTVLLSKVLDSQGTSEQSEGFFHKIANQLLELFFKSPNEYRGTIIPNKLINGILNCLVTIVQKKPKIAEQISSYKEELIRKGLFCYDIKEKISNLIVEPELLVSNNQLMHFDDYVKCKTEENRKVLMEIVYLLYKNSSGNHSNFFETYIIPIFNELVDTSKKNSLRCMHVGLTNFGSTCYMNSMLQVLNSIDIFRNSILMADVDIPLIRELKSLFSYLFFSERIDYPPKQLLNSFVPPINPGIQQDTTEFLNFLFDQVQEALKKTPYNKVLPELFQGNQVAQMICHNCGAKRERIEQFFTYGVEMEGKYDLHSALEGMHGGELISDCLCQSCNTRSDTTKRNVLNVVPNIFFVHLKRIVFNYDMFMNTKIHTRLFFPDELNFEPYTKEGLELREQLGVEYIKSLQQNEQQRKKFQEQCLHGHPKEYYQLKLKGVIVHSGTPDVGHYYAILKKNGNWIKFDDSRVTTFPQMSFEDECYGGNWISDEWGGSGSSKNAYVLVYEKQFKNDIEYEKIADDGKVVKQVVPYQQCSKTFNTVQWYKDVWLDNHSLMLQQQLIGESYTKEFLKFICAMLQLISSDSTIQLISEIFFKISALSGEVGTLPDIFNKNLNKIKTEMFKKYVLEDKKRTFNQLFHHQSKVRDFAAVYIERLLIYTYLNGTQQDKDEVMKFIQQYLQLLHNDAAKNWLRIDGYFQMFDRLVYTSINEPACYPIYQFFISIDLITYFIDFALEKQSPLNYIQKKYSLGTKSNPLNFWAGINTIYQLVRLSNNMTGTNYEHPPVDPKYLFHLSDNAIYCLNCMAFFEKMIKENQYPENLSHIIERLCIQNLPFSQSIARVLLKVINENTEASDEMDAVLLCVNRFMRITDQFWIKRAEVLLGVPAPFIYQQNILSSIDQEKYVFPSVLENIFPLESLLNYSHINRMRAPLAVLNILKNILEGTSVSPIAMQYMLKMPSPCYYYLRYVDWVRPYVNSVINHLNLTDKKKEEVQGKIAICNLYLDDLEKVKKDDMNILILGEVEKKELIETITSSEGDAYVNIYSVPVWVAPSRPNGCGNDTFDAHLKNGRLEKKVTADSNILKFFKQSSKALAIKAKAVEENEDKEIVGLFDQNPYPVGFSVQTEEDQPMEIEPPVQKEKVQEKVQVKEDKEQMKVEATEEAPKQEEPKEQVNVESVFFEKDYLRCMEFVNKSEISKIMIINVNSNDHTNTTLPTNIKFGVSKATEDFYYTKIDHTKPWGDHEKQLYVFNNVENPKPFIRLYQSPLNLPQMKDENNEAAASLFQNEQMDVEEKKEETPEGAVDSMNDGMMNCPICTFINASSNQNCEVCESPLH